MTAGLSCCSHCHAERDALTHHHCATNEHFELCAPQDVPKEPTTNADKRLESDLADGRGPIRGAELLGKPMPLGLLAELGGRHDQDHVLATASASKCPADTDCAHACSTTHAANRKYTYYPACNRQRHVDARRRDTVMLSLAAPVLVAATDETPEYGAPTSTAATEAATNFGTTYSVGLNAYAKGEYCSTPCL